MHVFRIRPEGIEVVLLVQKFQKHHDTFREMLNMALNIFYIRSDFGLNIIKKRQIPYNVTDHEKIFNEVSTVLNTEPPMPVCHKRQPLQLRPCLLTHRRTIEINHKEVG